VYSTRNQQHQLPSRKNRVKIAAHAGLDERTVTRHLLGQTRAHELTERAIREAAQALGIVLEVQP
jgi:DNA-binding LacI/PurR family transcriptional regulator